MPEAAPADKPTIVHVMDFRRRNLVLQWQALNGTWTACEYPPPLVHGVALISPTGANISLYGLGGRLVLQLGATKYTLEDEFPRITCRGGLILFGLRRRFLVRTQDGQIAFSYRYWRPQGRDFHRWLAQKAGSVDWRTECAEQWSAGVAPSDFPLPRQ